MSGLLGKAKAYLQLGRAQTYPADWLLVMTPFLAGFPDLGQILILSVLMFFIHWASFGENSVLDFTQGFDKVDPAKSHHPLSDGRISIPSAMNAIHYTKALSSVAAILLIAQWSPNPTMAMAALFLWYAWGTAYNVGLSKTSVFGFVTIVLCFAAMGTWGWFLTHATLTPLGWAYIMYAATIILFQIAWSGHLKDLKQGERSNILVLLGASIHTVGDSQTLGDRNLKYFDPGMAKYLGFGMKIAGIVALSYLFLQVPFDIGKAVWFSLIIIGMTIMMFKMIPGHYWNRAKDLRMMSIMEILSIFAPVPLMLDPLTSLVILGFAITWFFVANRKLWGTTLYPKV